MILWNSIYTYTRIPVFSSYPALGIAKSIAHEHAINTFKPSSCVLGIKPPSMLTSFRLIHMKPIIDADLCDINSQIASVRGEKLTNRGCDIEFHVALRI